MNDVLAYFMLAFAIERLTEVTTHLDLLEGMRSRIKRMFPRIGILAECKFCQTFWLSMVAGWTMSFPVISCLFPDPIVGYVAKSMVLWFSCWGLALVMDEYMDRYLNRAPLDVVMKKIDIQT